MQEPQHILEAWACSVLPRAVAYAGSLLGSYGEAEDVVHDVLCRLLSHEEYDMRNEGEKLLFRSITNACINRWKRRRTIVSLDAGMRDDSGSLVDILPSATRDPAEEVATSDLLDRLELAMRGLPPPQRAAVELKAMGYALKEIAEMLEVSATNAGVLVHRGRRALESLMAPVLAQGEPS